MSFKSYDAKIKFARRTRKQHGAFIDYLYLIIAKKNTKSTEQLLIPYNWAFLFK